jgi:hypothetical protein
VSYRKKPELFSGRSSPEERRQQRYIFWLVPFFVITPNVGRIAKALGLEKGSDAVLYGTAVLVGALCIAGAIFSYRSAQE